MSTNVPLTRLIYLALGVSLLLWLTNNYISMSCDMIETADERQDYFQGADRSAKQETQHTDTPQTSKHTEQVLKWFQDSLPSDIPRLYSSCPPVITATTHQTIRSTSSSLHHKKRHVLTVIGEINLNETNLNHLMSSLNIPLLGDTVISSFISPLNPTTNALQKEQHDDVTKLNNILDSLTNIGIYLLSLAHQHSLDITEQGTTLTIHSLEKAGIKWVGLNARQSDVLYIGSVKVGIISFCGVHGQCLDSTSTGGGGGTTGTSLPFAPNKFFIKSAREAIIKLKQSRKVNHVVVLLHWGKEQSLYPDETILYIARHLSDVEGVSAIIGYHPQTVHGHAYFGNTLVIFSPGNFIIGSESSSLCWTKDEKNQWKYREKDTSCQGIHPALRQSMKERELETIIYRLEITESSVLVGEYSTAQIHDTGYVRYPQHSSLLQSSWTTICGDSDDRCLSCQPF